jgi:poly(3-hydroxybutyrate) depolymerase
LRETLKHWLALICLVSAGAAHAADVAAVEPIEDLQWLFIEDTVALITPPNASIGDRARGLMDQAAAARAQGDLSEMRRLLSEARVILANRQWDAGAAYVASLAIRPHESVIDSSQSVVVEIAQYFSAQPPTLEPILLEIGVRPWRARGPASQDVEWRSKITARGTDFAENPVIAAVSLAGLVDGSFDLVVRATQGSKTVGTTARRVFVVRHLNRDLALIEKRMAAVEASQSLKASILYPLDLIKGLNDRSRQVRNIDIRAQLDRSLALLTAAEAGRDPLTRSKGSVERHYWLEESARYEPYRLIVPESWDGASALPLVVVLHGSNGDHDSVLNNRALIAQADAKGWAILSPMGYSPNSGWGNHLPVVLANGTMPRPRPSTIGGVVLPKDGIEPEPAERDVLRTIAAVRAEYPIDGRRIYLIGNSMGGEGTWHLAARLPNLWAAVAPAAGAIDPQRFDYAALGRLPVLAVHGQQDPIVAYAASQDMVARLQAQGGDARLLTVVDGGHDAVYNVLPEVFRFFEQHARSNDGSVHE